MLHLSILNWTWPMKMAALLAAILLGGPAPLAAAESIPAAKVKWLGLTGVPGEELSRDAPVFTLVGSGTAEPPDREAAKRDAAMTIALARRTREVIAKWLQEHPKAIVVPVVRIPSDSRAVRKNAAFVWVVDGEHHLNVELVRQGLLPPEWQAAAEKEKLEVPRADYDTFTRRVMEAGKEAKEKKVGRWMEIPK
jgi:hypothetical protein